MSLTEGVKMQVGTQVKVKDGTNAGRTAVVTETASRIKFSDGTTQVIADSRLEVVVSQPPPAKEILWGALMEGVNTYGGTFGNTPWDANTWNKFEASAGKKASLCHYGQPFPTIQARFYGSVADLCYARGAIPLMSMNTPREAGAQAKLAAGGYDAAITAWAKEVALWGKPIFFRFNWEPNGKWFPWGAEAAANPAVYVAAWKRFKDLCDKVGATNLTWVWCMNTIFTGSTPIDKLYPGDAYVDWTSIDGYNKGALVGDAWVSFTQRMQPTYDALMKLAPTKPVVISEYSSSEKGAPSGESKAKWIADHAKDLPVKFPMIRGVIWFNWKITENGIVHDWPIESSTAAAAAYKAAMALPYFRTGNLTAGPAKSKVKALA